MQQGSGSSRCGWTRWLGLTLALALSAGCAADRVDWDSRLGGYSYDEAVVELGPPDKEATLSDGSIVAEWLTGRSGGTAGVGYYGGYGYGWRRGAYFGPAYYDVHSTPAREYWLRLTFDQEGTLTGWRDLVR